MCFFFAEHVHVMVEVFWYPLLNGDDFLVLGLPYRYFGCNVSCQGNHVTNFNVIYWYYFEWPCQLVVKRNINIVIPPVVVVVVPNVVCARARVLGSGPEPGPGPGPGPAK